MFAIRRVVKDTTLLRKNACSGIAERSVIIRGMGVLSTQKAIFLLSLFQRGAHGSVGVKS
jgi:hypothetical protein